LRSCISGRLRQTIQSTAHTIAHQAGSNAFPKVPCKGRGGGSCGKRTKGATTHQSAKNRGRSATASHCGSNSDNGGQDALEDASLRQTRAGIARKLSTRNQTPKGTQFIGGDVHKLIVRATALISEMSGCLAKIFHGLPQHPSVFEIGDQSSNYLSNVVGVLRLTAVDRDIGASRSCRLD
jgi:hypothetical protein